MDRGVAQATYIIYYHEMNSCLHILYYSALSHAHLESYLSLTYYFATDKDVIHDQVSRYDPSNMNRIGDLANLAISDDSSDSDDDVIFPGQQVSNSSKNNNNNNRYGPSSSCGDTSTPIIRKTVVIISLVGIIIGASAAIGYTVVNSATTVSLLSAADGSDSSSESSNGQQHLLEMAEHVITACDENRLNEDISECQKLCYSRMCCFEKDEYGCQADAGKDCAVYAGCEALVQGVLDEE